MQAARAYKVRVSFGNVLKKERPSNRFQHPHFNMQASGSGHVDQGIQAEQVDLSAHQVRDARLGDAEQLGSLRLVQARAGQMRLQRHHQS